MITMDVIKDEPLDGIDTDEDDNAFQATMDSPNIMESSQNSDENDMSMT